MTKSPSMRAFISALVVWTALCTTAGAIQISVNYNWTSAAQSIQVEAFSADNSSLGIVPASYYETAARYYIVGNPDATASTRLNYWHTLIENSVAYYLDALREFVYQNPSYSFRLEMVSFVTVRTAPLSGGWWLPHGYLPPADFVLHGLVGLPNRIANDDLEPLDELFVEWFNEKGYVLSDDILRYYFYDYYGNDAWRVIPTFSDTRVLFFNKTTFDALGLKYPPPYGDWGSPSYLQNWTWDVFSDYAARIKQAGYSSGFDFVGCQDEEWRTVNFIAFEYGGRLRTPDGKCGVKNAYAQVFDKIARRWYLTDKSATEFINTSDPQFNNWVNSPVPDSPLYVNQKFPASRFEKCRPATGYVDFPGFLLGNSFVTSRFIPESYGWNMQSQPNATLFMCYLPSRATFLGGGGFAIPKSSPNKAAAWKFAKLFIDPNSPFMRASHEYLNLPPPYESAALLPPFNTEKYAVSAQQLRRALPIQYPLRGQLETGELSAQFPMRAVLMEFVYKNITAEQAANRFCMIADYIYQRKCDATDYIVNLSCTTSNDKLISYSWNETTDCKVEAAKLPSAITSGRCAFIVADSAWAIGLWVSAAVAIAINVATAIIIFIFRERAVIRQSSWFFSICILVGSAICNTFILAIIGPPDVGTCIISIWLLSVGYVILFGSFIVKMTRIDRLFHAPIDKGVYEISDLFLLRYLGIFIAVDILILIVWTFLSPVPQAATVPVNELAGLMLALTQPSCSGGNPVGIVLLFLYKVILLLYGGYLSYHTRNAAEQYSEQRFAMGAMVIIMFAAIVIVPLTFLLEANTKMLIACLGVLFASLASSTLYIGQKFITLREEKHLSLRSSGLKTSSHSSRHGRSHMSQQYSTQMTMDNYSLRSEMPN